MKSLIVIALALTSVVSFASDKKEVKTETTTVETTVPATTAAPVVEVAPVAKKAKKHAKMKKVTTEVKSVEVAAPVEATTTK